MGRRIKFPMSSAGLARTFWLGPWTHNLNELVSVGHWLEVWACREQAMTKPDPVSHYNAL